MSDTSPFGFGRFVPGFDFLQSLAKGTATGAPAMPAMSSWVAPTVSVEELSKRIEELKAVQFWLEQNSRALAATVQALEVQKMTLSTLQGMNVAMGDLASAFAPKPAPASSEPQPAPEPPAAAPQEPAADDAAEAPASAAPGVVDPLQWWSALTNQFQQIAAHAMQDAAHNPALDATRDMAAEAMKTASGMASHLAAQGVQGVQDATRMAMGAATAAAPSQPKAAKAARKPAAKPAKAPAKPAAKKAAGSTASAARKAPRAAAKKPPARKPAR